MNGFDDFDTKVTAEEFYAGWTEDEADYLAEWGEPMQVGSVEEDGEPEGSHDLSDDGDALASAGFGTDEDYGYFGEDF